jgi:hypothetical protein
VGQYAGYYGLAGATEDFRLNQTVARLTYPRFIERLGGVATHRDWVLNEGYGYGETVTRLLAVIRECDLTPDELTDGLTTINREHDLMRSVPAAASLLAKRSGYPEQKIQAALALLSAPLGLFTAALGEIRS